MPTSTTSTIIIISLATALFVSIIVFPTVITVILMRSKAKIKAALEITNRAERSTHMESMYEDVTGPLPSVSAINTQGNVAYGHIKTATTTT